MESMHLLIDDKVDNENLYLMVEYYELIQQVLLDSIDKSKFRLDRKIYLVSAGFLFQKNLMNIFPRRVLIVYV